MGKGPKGLRLQHSALQCGSKASAEAAGEGEAVVESCLRVVVLWCEMRWSGASDSDQLQVAASQPELSQTQAISQTRRTKTPLHHPQATLLAAAEARARSWGHASVAASVQASCRRRAMQPSSSGHWLRPRCELSFRWL